MIAITVLSSGAMNTPLAADVGDRPQVRGPTNIDERCGDLSTIDLAFGDTWIPVNEGDLTPKVAEGSVTYARIASEDHPFNHESQDFVFNVLLDNKYHHLLSGVPPHFGAVENMRSGEMHMEWENKYFNMFAWPSVGNRVWMAGMWIWDCGHRNEPKTELHPAVGVATMRSMPIRHDDCAVPCTPGVRVDIWFNHWGGPASEAYICQDAWQDNQGCVFSPSDLDVWQNWEFDVDLPLQWPIPLQTTVGVKYRILPGPVGGGPDPVITPETGTCCPDSVHVVLPLEGFTGSVFSRSIEVYYDDLPALPSHIYAIDFDSINIRTDHDNILAGDGEYRLRINVNDQWFKLVGESDAWLTSEDVEEQRYTLGTSVQVAVFDSSGITQDTLWPRDDWSMDVIHIHAAGFEDDELLDDNPGVAEQRYKGPDFGVIAPGTSETWIDTPYKWDPQWPEGDTRFDRIRFDFHNLFAREGYEKEGNHDDCEEDFPDNTVGRSRSTAGSCFSLRYRISLVAVGSSREHAPGVGGGGICFAIPVSGILGLWEVAHRSLEEHRDPASLARAVLSSFLLGIVCLGPPELAALSAFKKRCPKIGRNILLVMSGCAAGGFGLTLIAMSLNSVGAAMMGNIMLLLSTATLAPPAVLIGLQAALDTRARG